MINILLELKEVTHKYKNNTTLKKVNLRIKSGEKMIMNLNVEGF